MWMVCIFCFYSSSLDQKPNYQENHMRDEAGLTTSNQRAIVKKPVYHKS